MNIVNKFGETAFGIASTKNNEKCVSILAQEGADVNTSPAAGATNQTDNSSQEDLLKSGGSGQESICGHVSITDTHRRMRRVFP